MYRFFTPPDIGPGRKKTIHPVIPPGYAVKHIRYLLFLGSPGFFEWDNMVMW
jgi:hypothetical protein